MSIIDAILRIAVQAHGGPGGGLDQGRMTVYRS